MQQRPVLDILCILCIHVYYEPFAKFAIGNDMEAAKVMCCRLRHSPQKAQNEFLDFVSCRSDGPFCVFVPFVAIPGKGPAAKFSKRLDLLIGGGDKRSRGVICEGHKVIPRKQSCRSNLVTLVVEEGSCVFVSIRVHSWFVFYDDWVFFLE